MSVIQVDFNETNDIYLQILTKAQYAEDKKLIVMVMERLKEKGPLVEMPEPVCDVIPFPGCDGSATLRGEKTPLVFKTGYPQLFIIVGVYLALATVSIMLS